MKRAKTVKTLKSTAATGLALEIRHYDDGRYGFDWRDENGTRKKIRCTSLDRAMVRAKEYLDAGKAGRLDLLGITSSDLEEFLRWRERRRTDTPKIPLLVEQLLESKKDKGRSAWTLASLKTALVPFSEKFDCSIDKVSRLDLEGWLSRRDIGARRFNNIVSAIGALCRFARFEGHIGSELLPIERISRRFHRPKIATYTRDELIAILRAAPNEWLPTIILGAFTGLRPEECAPDPRTAKPGLTWQNVNWTKGYVDVSPEVSKGTAGGKGRRRFPPLCDAARDFLQPWRNAVGRVAPIGERLSNSKRFWKLPVDWKQDALRHSYASYRLAIIRSVPELSIEMGNSIEMCKQHYIDAKLPDEAHEWFALRRSDVWNSTELSERKLA